MLKKVLVVLALFVSGVLFAEGVNISVVTHGNDADGFWTMIKNGLHEAESDLKSDGVKIDYRNPPAGDLTEMGRLIDSAVAKRPDGLIVTIPDYDALGASIKKATKLGIPVIVINSGKKYTKDVGGLLYVGQSEYTAGFKAGEKAKKDGVKSFVCINQDIINSVLEQRCKGFADALGVKNNMIDVSQDPTTIEKKVKTYLGKVDAFLTLGDVGAAPTIRVIKNARMEDKVYFVTFDLSQNIIDGIKDGIVKFAIDQQPFVQGYFSVVILDKYLKYGVLQSGDLNSGPGFVTKSNVEQVAKFAGTYR